MQLPPPTARTLLAALCLVAGLAGASCKPNKPATSTGEPAPAQPVKVEQHPKPAKREPLPTGPAEIWKEFSGDKAFEEARKQVEIGPRPSGSPEIEKARIHIESALKSNGWEVERQAFTAETPRGPLQFINLIGRFVARGVRPVPTDTQRAIVCSHFDTKRFSTIRFVGASDGASSTGALIELSRVLALSPAMAEQIELVFFDGEEAIVQYDDRDGLYGSRYYANQLRTSNRHTQFKFAILWDMIGDRDFRITLSPDSPKELMNGILDSASLLQHRDRFTYYNRNIYDDHVPLNVIANIPAIDLIDFDFPAWHTADDTLDRIAPESMRITGAVTLHYLRQQLLKGR